MKHYDGQAGENRHLQKIVGYYNNHAQQTNPEPVQIGWFLFCCEEVGAVDMLDTLRALTDTIQGTTEPATLKELQQKKKAIKTALPCVTPAAYYPTTHKLDDTHTGSGLFCIDLDRKDNPDISREDWGNLPQNLMQSALGRYIAYIGESASGWECGGYFLLVACPTDTKRHAQRVAAFVKVLEGAGIKADRQAGNLNHCRALSRNDNAGRWQLSTTPDGQAEPIFLFAALPVSNPDAVEFVSEYEPPKPTRQKITTPKGLGRDYNDFLRVKRCVEYMAAHKIDLTNGYENWMRYAFALANEFGQNGKALFIELAKISDKYDETENEYLWAGAMNKRKGKSRVNTFWHLVKLAGYSPKQF